MSAPAGQPMRYTFHDFRRLYNTDAIIHGMPPHITQLVVGGVSVIAAP
jgi:hypothetical protein